jgi:hypothetical protein
MALSKEAKEARNQYFKKWRQNNRDKVRAAQERYWQRKAQKEEEKAGQKND